MPYIVTDAQRASDYTFKDWCFELGGAAWTGYQSLQTVMMEIGKTWTGPQATTQINRRGDQPTSTERVPRGKNNVDVWKAVQGATSSGMTIGQIAKAVNLAEAAAETTCNNLRRLGYIYPRGTRWYFGKEPSATTTTPRRRGRPARASASPQAEATVPVAETTAQITTTPRRRRQATSGKGVTHGQLLGAIGRGCDNYDKLCAEFPQTGRNQISAAITAMNKKGLISGRGKTATLLITPTGESERQKLAA